jgi:hypothetical protein
MLVRRVRQEQGLDARRQAGQKEEGGKGKPGPGHPKQNEGNGVGKEKRILVSCDEVRLTHPTKTGKTHLSTVQVHQVQRSLRLPDGPRRPHVEQRTPESLLGPSGLLKTPPEIFLRTDFLPNPFPNCHRSPAEIRQGDPSGRRPIDAE